MKIMNELHAGMGTDTYLMKPRKFKRDGLWIDTDYELGSLEIQIPIKQKGSPESTVFVSIYGEQAWHFINTNSDERERIVVKALGGEGWRLAVDEWLVENKGKFEQDWKDFMHPIKAYKRKIKEHKAAKKAYKKRKKQ